MKSSKLIAFLFAIMTMQTTNLAAQNNTEAPLLTSTEITVKQGHNVQFMDAVKKWKECYLENNGPDTWNIWRRVQGEGTVYILSGNMKNWAEMDKEDAAGEECGRIVLNDILPHVEKTSYRVSRLMPEISREPSVDMGLVWVTYFKVKNFDDFNEIIKGATAAVKAKEGSYRGIWYSNIGGPGINADYFVSTPFKNFAELDIERDTPAKIYGDAVGEKKAATLSQKWRDAVEEEWSYILRLNKELSHQ